jgi:hypothetical protein
VNTEESFDEVPNKSKQWAYVRTGVVSYEGRRHANEDRFALVKDLSEVVDLVSATLRTGSNTLRSTRRGARRGTLLAHYEHTM